MSTGPIHPVAPREVIKKEHASRQDEERGNLLEFSK
jgi:hypothetical protein